MNWSGRGRGWATPGRQNAEKEGKKEEESRAIQKKGMRHASKKKFPARSCSTAQQRNDDDKHCKRPAIIHKHICRVPTKILKQKLNRQKTRHCRHHKANQIQQKVARTHGARLCTLVHIIHTLETRARNNRRAEQKR